MCECTIIVRTSTKPVKCVKLVELPDSVITVTPDIGVQMVGLCIIARRKAALPLFDSDFTLCFFHTNNNNNNKHNNKYLQ